MDRQPHDPTTTPATAAPDQELGEEELATVSGGRDAASGLPTGKSEYLVVKMTDILISG